MIPKAGKSYHVDHSRQGQFDMEVWKVFEDKQGEHWASGPITAGTAKQIASDDYEAGDHITVRVSLATFEEIVG